MNAFCSYTYIFRRFMYILNICYSIIDSKQGSVLILTIFVNTFFFIRKIAKKIYFSSRRPPLLVRTPSLQFDRVINASGISSKNFFFFLVSLKKILCVRVQCATYVQREFHFYLSEHNLLRPILLRVLNLKPWVYCLGASSSV